MRARRGKSPYIHPYVGYLDLSPGRLELVGLQVYFLLSRSSWMGNGQSLDYISLFLPWHKWLARVAKPVQSVGRVIISHWYSLAWIEGYLHPCLVWRYISSSLRPLSIQKQNSTILPLLDQDLGYSTLCINCSLSVGLTEFRDLHFLHSGVREQ